MANKFPLVSVGIPVYNGENHLREALESLLAQTYQNFEILTSDNCSSDGTQTISEEFTARNSRVRYVSHSENRGASASYNYLVHHTTGKYFKWAGHDDLCRSDFLRKCIDQLERDISVCLAATKTTIIDQNSLEILKLDREFSASSDIFSVRVKDYSRFYESDRDANQVFGVYRRSSLLKTSLIANYPASDLLLLGQIAMLGKVMLIDSPIFYRRDHDNTSLRANSTPSKVAQWFDTSKTENNRPLHYFSRLRDLLVFLPKAPGSLKEKLVALSSIARWVWRKKRLFLNQLKAYVIRF